MIIKEFQEVLDEMAPEKRLAFRRKMLFGVIIISLLLIFIGVAAEIGRERDIKNALYLIQYEDYALNCDGVNVKYSDLDLAWLTCNDLSAYEHFKFDAQSKKIHCSVSGTYKLVQFAIHGSIFLLLGAVGMLISVEFSDRKPALTDKKEDEEDEDGV